MIKIEAPPREDQIWAKTREWLSAAAAAALRIDAAHQRVKLHTETIEWIAATINAARHQADATGDMLPARRLTDWLELTTRA